MIKKNKENNKTNNKNKILKNIIIFIIILLIIIMFPILILSGSILLEIIFDRPPKPKIKTSEFPFELIYEYGGEQFTIKESIICEYEGIEFSLEGGNSRKWNCYITNNEDGYGQFYLDEEKYPTLHIQIPLNANYWMGDPKASEEFATPYIFLVDDNTGTTYYEQDLMDVVGAKIISWKPSKILEGNIK